jgi:hypothetical protein
MTLPFEATDARKSQVEVLAGLGLPHEQISLIIGCDAKTLRHYFHHELKSGNAKATAKVAQTLFNKAIGGDVASMIFWMKVRAGWSERTILSHTGPDGESPVGYVIYGSKEAKSSDKWLKNEE